MKTEPEQGIWNEYSRLIEKPIIHNSMQLLSRQYEQIARHTTMLDFKQARCTLNNHRLKPVGLDGD